MATRHFDTTAESKTRPASAGGASATVTSEHAGPVHRGGNLPAHTVAAQLARSSGGHLTRAGNALLQLQRLHGNRYVQRVLEHTRQVFTSGADIFFTSGGYRPASSAGQALLAHELTHVAQQGAAGHTIHVAGRAAAEERTSPPINFRRSGPVVQRAILAIDGAGDGRVAKKATRNCLSNLRYHKQVRTPVGKVVQDYPAGDARGEVYGPARAKVALRQLKNGSSTIGPLETLYLLGHGSLTDIGGLTPADLVTGLVNAFAGYPGTFIGALKIVACYSASTMADGVRAPSGKSYANRTRSRLDTKNDPKFRPRFVEGIKGIAWADEDTGQRVGYEVLGQRKGKLSPLEQVYADASLEKKWYRAISNPDAATRKADMDIILKRMHKRLGKSATDRRVLGDAARKRYLSKSGPSDYKMAAGQLRLVAESEPPNEEQATVALKRMRLDWELMDEAERKTVQNEAILAYEAYIKAFWKTLSGSVASS